MAATMALSPRAGITSGKMRIETDSRRTKPRTSDRKNQLDDVSVTPSSDNPLRILAPGQKKLTTIESLRVIAVMDEAIRRLDGAMVIPIIAASLDRFSISLGAELVGMLNDYTWLVSEYTTVYESMKTQGCNPDLESSTVDGSDSGTSSSSSLIISGRPVRLEPLEPDHGLVALEARFQQIRSRLKHKIKCILRELSKNPSTSEFISSSKGTGPPQIKLLQEEVRKLREVVHEKLLTTHMEEVKKKEHLKEVTQRQLLAEKQIAKLEAELLEEQQKKGKMVLQKSAEIKHLKSTIKGVVNLAEDRNRRVKVDAHNQQIQDQKVHETKVNTLEGDITTLTKKFQQVTSEHREKEQTLRKRAFKRETELENWIQKYDHEMGEKQDDLEQLEEEYKQETIQLKELEEKLEILTTEYSSVIAEQEEARKKAEESAHRMGQMVRAAILIQGVWKAYRERTKGKKKGKGKGKGKGKKGKGKGKKGKGKGKKKKKS